MKPKSNLDYAVIGKRIKELRTAKKWTQTKLAEESSVEPAYISHIERGEAMVSLPTLVNLVNALDSTLDYVVYTNLRNSSHISVGMINELLADCTPEEISLLTEVLKNTKGAIRSKK